MTETYVVIGPPGTGKTTWASRQVKAAVDKHGPQGAIVCSLTKAAAAEAAGRETGLDPDMVGTLHSFAYRISSERKVFSAKHVDPFNNAAGMLHLTESYIKTGKAESDGDRAFSMVDIHRARCTPESMWGVRERKFRSLFKDYCYNEELLSFTDMIELALDEMPIAPNSPAVIIVDEAQDCNTLEWKLINSWGLRADKLIIVGDHYQSLYGWRGSDVSPLMDTKPFATLSQSYRVPKAVHQYACGIIKKMGREVPDYKPRDADGLVRRIGSTYQDPGSIAKLVADHVQDGRTLMILASCDYMLKGIVRWLRDQGYPYHNPYALGRWSPLKAVNRFHASSNPKTTTDRLVAFLAPKYREDEFWGIADLKAFAPLLKVGGVMKRGSKKAIEELKADTQYVTREDVATLMKRYFEPVTIKCLAKVDPNWLRANSTAAKQLALEYPVKIYNKSGIDGLTNTPLIIVGTIHSVKGGQADSVLLFPDLSREGMETMGMPGWEGRDAIHRLFYVGATRAREELYLGEPTKGWNSYTW